MHLPLSIAFIMLSNYLVTRLYVGIGVRFFPWRRGNEMGIDLVEGILIQWYWFIPSIVSVHTQTLWRMSIQESWNVNKSMSRTEICHLDIVFIKQLLCSISVNLFFSPWALPLKYVHLISNNENNYTLKVNFFFKSKNSEHFSFPQ